MERQGGIPVPLKSGKELEDAGFEDIDVNSVLGHLEIHHEEIAKQIDSRGTFQQHKKKMKETSPPQQQLPDPHAFQGNNSSSSSSKPSTTEEVPVTPEVREDEEYFERQNADTYEHLDARMPASKQIKYIRFMLQKCDEFMEWCEILDFWHHGRQTGGLRGKKNQKRFLRLINAPPIPLTSLYKLVVEYGITDFILQNKVDLEPPIPAGKYKAWSLLLFYTLLNGKLFNCVTRLSLCRVFETIYYKIDRRLVSFGKSFLVRTAADFTYATKNGLCCIDPKNRIVTYNQSQVYNAFRLISIQWHQLTYHEELADYMMVLFARFSMILYDRCGTDVFNHKDYRVDSRTKEQKESKTSVSYVSNMRFLWDISFTYYAMIAPFRFLTGYYCCYREILYPEVHLCSITGIVKVPVPTSSTGKGFRDRPLKKEHPQDKDPQQLYTFDKDRSFEGIVKEYFVEKAVTKFDSADSRKNVLAATFVAKIGPGEMECFQYQQRGVKPSRPQTFWLSVRSPVETTHMQTIAAGMRRDILEMIEEPVTSVITSGQFFYKSFQSLLNAYVKDITVIKKLLPIVYDFDWFNYRRLIKDHSFRFWIDKKICNTHEDLPGGVILCTMGETFLLMHRTLFRVKTVCQAIFWWIMTTPMKEIFPLRDDIRAHLERFGVKYRQDLYWKNSVYADILTGLNKRPKTGWEDVVDAMWPHKSTGRKQGVLWEDDTEQMVRHEDSDLDKDQLKAKQMAEQMARDKKVREKTSTKKANTRRGGRRGNNRHKKYVNPNKGVQPKGFS